MAVRGTGSLFFASGIDNSGLKQGTLDAIGLVQGMASTISKISPFAALSIGAATAFAKIAYDAYTMMNEFEHAMKEVQTISKATQEDFEGISSAVFALSKISPDAPVKLAKAYYQIVSAGYDGAAGLELLETAAKAATAGVTDTATAADGITTVLNAFKLEATEADKVADIMFNTVRLGKTTFDELSRSLSEVAPLAAASGFNFEEVAAATATLTKQGVPTSQAMTQIRSAIESVGEVLGDGAAKSMTLQNAFQAIYDKANGSQTGIKELTGRMEAMNAILAIAGPNAQGAAADLQEMANAAGSAEVAFERMAGSNVNAWQILTNRIKAYTEELGNSLVGVSNDFAGFVNDFLDDTENITQKVRRESNEFNTLRNAVLSSNTSFKQKIEALNELKRLYPEYLTNLETNKINEDNLETSLLNVRDALIAINEEQERRLKLSGANQKVNESEKRAAEELSNFEEQNRKFYRIVEEIKTYAAENDIPLNIDFSKDPEELATDLFFAFNRKDVSLIGKGQGLINELLNVSEYIEDYRNRLGEANRELEINEKNALNVKKATYDNANAYKTIVEEIKNINNLSKLEDYSVFEYSAIQEAYKARQEILKQFQSIDQVQKLESLKPFLDSEIAEIREYAEKRKRYINTDFSGGGGDAATELDKYKDFLKQREKAYQEYEAAVIQLGKESADAQNQELLKQGKNLGEFYQNQLNKTQNFARQTAIAVAAQNNGINLNRPQVQGVSSIQSQPINLEYRIDQTSINFIKEQIKQLTEEFEKANEKDRPEIKKQLEYWEERLNVARNGSKEEQNLFEKIYLRIEDLSYKDLIEYRKYWKKRAEEAAKGSKNEQEAIQKFRSADEEIASRFSDRMGDISSGISEAGKMFRKFGDEDLAQTMEQLSDLSNQFANIGIQLASGNYIGAAISAVAAIGSQIAGGDNGPSEFEKQMDRLDRSIKRLNNSLGQLYGAEGSQARKKVIENLRAQEEKYKDLVDYSKEQLALWKDVDSFIGESNRDLFTQMLDNAEDKLSEIRKEIADSQDEFDEYFTGTTQSTLADSIIQGLRDGKKGIEDFAGTFEDAMREAMLNSLLNNFLSEKVAGFMDDFYDFSSDSEGLTAAEIAKLRGDWNNLIEQTGQYWEGLEDIMGNAGVDPFGNERNNRPGLAGAITNITEDTANVLEGYLNAIRIDVRQSLDIANRSSIYLSEISINTKSMDSTLKSLDSRMQTIENGIISFQSRS